MNNMNLNYKKLSLFILAVIILSFVVLLLMTSSMTATEPSITHNIKKKQPLSKVKKSTRKVVIDLHNKAFAAYNEEGELVRWGPISAGKDCSEFENSCSTPKGTFKIYRKENRKYKSKKYPKPFGGAPMPYAMFFSGGIALHGSTLPGRHDSHGCVRLLNEDAKWLNLEFTRINTRVIVQ